MHTYEAPKPAQARSGEPEDAGATLGVSLGVLMAVAIYLWLPR